MSTDRRNTKRNLTENELKITHLDCHSEDRNNENIIIEVKETIRLEKPSQAENNNGNDVIEYSAEPPDSPLDSPELLIIGDYSERPESVELGEPLFEEAEGQIVNSDDPNQLEETAEAEPVNILEDIPNEILVYTCQPEHDSEPLDKFPCLKCDIVVGCIFCLKSHFESVHLNLGLVQYKCHQTTYLKNYTEICHKCNLVCESKAEMIEHRQIHFVTCDVCDMSFDSALYLSNHCKATHQNYEVAISCDLCESWFKELQDLSDHYQSTHQMILCIVCYKRFSDAKELILHHSSHKIILSNPPEPVLPYACSKCNRAFAEICELSSHLVREHPTKKANSSYGVTTKRRKNTSKPKEKQMKKWKITYDDCGGLSQEDIILEVEEDILGTEFSTNEVLKIEME